jgi:hypothetical protein
MDAYLPFAQPACTSPCCGTCALIAPRSPGVQVLWMGVPENWVQDMEHLTEGSPRFAYLKVHDRLRLLPWSLQECLQRITYKGCGKSSGKPFSRHGLVQLALWTSDLFYGAPDGYIYDHGLKRPKTPPLHACPQRPQLFAAVPTALLRYESQCAHLYTWPKVRATMINGVEEAGMVSTILHQLRQKGYPPENPKLHYQFHKIQEAVKLLKTTSLLVTESDFQRAGGAVPKSSHPLSVDIKTVLIRDLHQAFKAYGPPTFGSMAIYRGIATILQAFGIQNEWAADFAARGVKKVLERSLSPYVELRIRTIMSEPA